MDARAQDDGTSLAPFWSGVLRTAAHAVGIDGEPVPVRTPAMTGAELVACVHSLGGTIQPGAPFYGWHVATRPRDEVEAISRFAPALVGAHLTADDFEGVARIELDHERFVALRTSERIWPGVLERIQLLAGPSLEATLRLATALERAREYIVHQRACVFGTVASLTLPRVAEDALVLPDDLKHQVLADVDAFWHRSHWAPKQNVTSRGLLFVGFKCARSAAGHTGANQLKYFTVYGQALAQ